MRFSPRALRAVLVALCRAVPLALLPALALAEGFEGAANFFESLYQTITDNDEAVITLAAVIGIIVALFMQSWKPFVIALIAGGLLASIDSLVGWFMQLFGG